MVMIKAVSLYKEYPIHGDKKTHAVRGVSLEIGRGCSMAITGPSGCGKTTLLNMIGLVAAPTAGDLYIEGGDAGLLSEKKKAAYRNSFYGYIVQDFALVEDYTVRENVEIPLLYSSRPPGARKRRERVGEVLGMVGLTDKVKEKTRNLSGGQRQRVAIARALVNNPQVILADEPTGSLDSPTGAEVLKLLFGLVRGGKTLLLVTHNLELAGLCERQLRMKDGCLVAN